MRSISELSATKLTNVVCVSDNEALKNTLYHWLIPRRCVVDAFRPNEFRDYNSRAFRTKLAILDAYDFATSKSYETNIANRIYEVTRLVAPFTDYVLIHGMQQWFECQDIPRNVEFVQRESATALFDSIAREADNGLTFGRPLVNSAFRPLVERAVQLISEDIQNADENLEGALFTIRFNFPNEFRPACEQYLIYFATFLADIGISASNDIKHKAGRVLFTVTPTDPDAALDNIREALSVYLRLPAAIETDDYSLGQEPAVQQMAANIQHLRGQLILAAATIQAKETAIQNQSITIDMLMRHTGPSEIMIRSMTPQPDDKAKEKEELFGGIVKVGDAEIGKSGVTISLAEVYRRFRDKFGKK